MSKYIKYGTTRTTFLIGKYAIKVPTLFKWKLFLCGLLGNMHEKEFEILRRSGGLPLCPILFYVWGGFLLVMPRCEVDLESSKNLDEFINDLKNLNENDQQIIKNIVEFKYDSVGRLNGKMVAIDYGS